jgi:hypothetical protein
LNKNDCGNNKANERLVYLCFVFSSVAWYQRVGSGKRGSLAVERRHLIYVVVVERVVQIGKRLLLELVRLLQLLDPVGFFGLQQCDLLFDLNAFFIFFVNLPDQLESLLLSLEVLLLPAHRDLLVLLRAHQLLHALRLGHLRVFLQSDHLCVLRAFLLQSRRLSCVRHGQLLLRTCQSVRPLPLLCQQPLVRRLPFLLALLLQHRFRL